MTFDEIIKIEDSQEKENKLKQFYINIGVEDWLTNKYDTQKISFADRIEYKENNKLHNLYGPAIELKNGTKYYYIDNKYLEYDEWKNESKFLLRKIKMKRVLNEKFI